MRSLKIDFKKINVIPAEKQNESHKKGIWQVFNENIGFNYLTSEPISYENHCKWWEGAFEIEYIHVILYDSKVSGYIRLTKDKTRSKEKYEISIAIVKEFQTGGFGSFAYDLFEKEMNEMGITEIIANTNIKNKLGQRFFEKNGFKKTSEKEFIRYLKKI